MSSHGVVPFFAAEVKCYERQSRPSCESCESISSFIQWAKRSSPWFWLIVVQLIVTPPSTLPPVAHQWRQAKQINFVSKWRPSNFPSLFLPNDTPSTSQRDMDRSRQILRKHNSRRIIKRLNYWYGTVKRFELWPTVWTLNGERLDFGLWTFGRLDVWTV